MTTTLFTNPYGFKFDRTDYKKRSKVKVHNNGFNLMTYRFNNVEFFESPYISWQNLDQCGGWATKDDYLKTSVQNGTKLFAQIIHADGEVFEESDNVVIRTKDGYDSTYKETHICRKGTLNDYYDLEAVFGHYRKLGLNFPLFEVRQIIPLLYETDISVFGTDEAPFDFRRPSTIEELIVDGLLLGYPLESTASLIQGY